jgi:3-oxoacyl-[acyl-carrier protein] reductase
MLDLGIAGRRAIVCASSRGLGKACARALARAGVAVVVNGLDEARLEATARELRKETGAEITPVAADVTTREGQAKLLAALPDPDILVTNAGGPPFRDFRELSREAMLTGVTWNMVTPIELIQATVDKMVERRFGRIVNITSISVRMPVQGLDLSSGARAGLTAFVAGVARSVAHAGVTINNVLPGFFDTDRYWAGIDATAKAQGKTREQFAEERASAVPMKRIGDPQELGDACAFLCSARAGYITGQNLLLDGGLFNSAF